MSRIARHLIPLALLAVLTGCKDNGPDITPTTIQIGPVVGGPTLVSGVTVPLTASVTNSGGSQLSGQIIQWTSSDPSIASVSTAGNVTAIHTGTAQITASVGTLRSFPVAITVTPGAPSQVAVRTQPAGGASGLPLTTQPVIEIQDAAGNLVTSSTATVTATIATGGGSLSGSTATADGGVATFLSLSISGIVGDRTLMFAVSGLSSVSSSGVAVGPGAATQLVIRTEPTGAASGAPFGTPPVLEIRDDAGNLVTGSTATVVVAVSSGGAGALSNGTAQAVGGVVTFTDLALSGLIGNRTLAFTSPGLTSAVSASFTLIAGKAVQLRIRTQPTGATSGRPLTTQPIVEVTDGAGNVVVSSTVTVNAVLTNSDGVMSGDNVVAVGGVATFNGLTIAGTVGPRTLTFSAPGLTSVTSTSFTLFSGLPSRLGIRFQPANAQTGAPLSSQPVIEVQDDAGNLATTYNGVVFASIASGSGSISGGGSAFVSGGVASFTSLAVTGPLGVVTISFSSGSLIPVTSIPVNVLPGPPARLVVRIAPPSSGPNGVALIPQPVVEVQDASGNRVAVPVTVTFTTDAVSGTIANASATTVNGVATFSGVALSGPLGARNYWFAVGSIISPGLYRITITP